MILNYFILLCMLTLISTKEYLQYIDNQPMILKSPAFHNGTHIPSKFTPKFMNPELVIENIPYEAKSLALVFEDIDGQRGIFYHWIVYNIPIMNVIKEASKPGKEVTNSWGFKDYQGPNPPSGQEHRYYFKIFALSKTISPEILSIEQFYKDIIPLTISKATLLGYYKN